MEGALQDNDRNISLDIARGIGIILVVICHIKFSFLTVYSYWFHMPLFFIISGFLFEKSNKKEGRLLAKIRDKTYKYLIPYCSFYFLILIVLRVDACLWPLITIEDVKILLIGGAELVGAFGPFWFITVLYLTQIVFLLITEYVNNKVGAIIIVFCYILSHVSLFRNTIIWDANVTLYALFFFGAGYMCAAYPLEKKFRKSAVAIAVIIVFLSIVLQTLGVMNYRLDMKSASYNNLILDIVIPTSFSLVVLDISRVLSKMPIGKCFAFIGKDTLPIMYLHIPISYLVLNHFDFQNLIMTIICIIAGIIFPILISRFVFEKFDITRKIFLGDLKRR